MGSSPRMRGTLVFDAGGQGDAGLIPTYAGNTSARLLLGGRIRAHPHVCGEHPTFRPVLPSPRGSSPRMRGTRAGGGETAYCLGLIPTYAGNTRLLPGC